MNRAITFFGQIFQPFQKTSSLRAPPRKYCVAYACARLLTLYIGRATATQPTLAACWFFHHPILNESASDFFLVPLSLAATNGVSVDFPSFSYSDVSVR
jgi:hypothetical protein